MGGTKKRVLVTGSSVAGPALAFLLDRLGWEVVLLERAPQFRTSGQNVDVRGPGHDALLRMGLLGEVKGRNTTEQAWTFVTRDNSTVARFDRETFGADGPTAELEILRGDLARVLDHAATGVEHRFGDAIAALEDDGRGVEVRFEDGAGERFDLVMTAEGIGSSTRKLAFGDEARVEPFGLSSAYFSIPKGASCLCRPICANGMNCRARNRSAPSPIASPMPTGRRRASSKGCGRPRISISTRSRS